MLSPGRLCAAAIIGVALAVATDPAATWADPSPGGGGNGSGGGGVSVSPSPTLPGVGIGVTSPGAGNASIGSGAHSTGSNSKDLCTYTAAVPPPGPSTPGGSEYAKYGGTVLWQTCPGGSGGYIWVPKGKAAPPPPQAIDLARTAYGQLPLLNPVPSRYPTGTLKDGRSYTIVQAHMWFATAPSSWAVRSKTVCAGGLCATAVAKPTTLTFDPGNGDGSVSCPGPGTTFQRAAGGSWVPGRQPQGCDYQYTKSSFGMPNGEVTSTYTVGWTVTWTANNGQGGTFNDLQTSTISRFVVAELQSVVTR